MAERDDDRGEAIVDVGYMGDDKAWCYWDSEYPDEGSCGPFCTRAEAVAAAEEAGHYVDTPTETPGSGGEPDAD